jgi:hypothetical protein
LSDQFGLGGTHAFDLAHHQYRPIVLWQRLDHYNTCMSLGLSSGEKTDLIQYLLSLTF